MQPPWKKNGLNAVHGWSNEQYDLFELIYRRRTFMAYAHARLAVLGARTQNLEKHQVSFFFIVAQCILITLKFLSPTNAPLYYTYKMLKYTVKISHDCSYMFRSTWTIVREPMPNLAKVTVLWRYSVKIRR